MSLFVTVPAPGVPGGYDLNPQYNLRILFPAQVRRALEGLYEERWEPWYGPYLRQHGLGEAQLLDGWAKYAQYVEACLEGLPQDGPRDALRQCGFLDLPGPVKLVILAKVGQLMTADAWVALRECTRYEALPVDVQSVARIGRRLCRDLLGGPSRE